MGKTSKDKRDIFYRKAKQEGWRARSAFKLLHIDETFNIFKDVNRAVDLCAAPGSWSQVLAKKLYTDAKNEEEILKCHPKIVAVDLQTMAPIPGVVQLKGDITNLQTAHQIIEHFKGLPADLVVCDGAPDITGLFDFDMFLQGKLVLSALNVAANVLKPGGTFIAKIFRGRDAWVLTNQLQTMFQTVVITKPPSSRNSSLEGFVLCQNYIPPPDFDPEEFSDYLSTCYFKIKGENNRAYVPFIVCGDMSGFNSDASYPLQLPGEEPYVYREPIQPPIDPPFKLAVDILKHVKNLDTSEIFDNTLKEIKAITITPTEEELNDPTLTASEIIKKAALRQLQINEL